MKRVSKFALIVLCAIVLTLGRYGVVRSHCEIPCGIYGDKTRIDLLYEDIATIEKSMQQIAVEMKNDNINQVVRWVKNKEEHAGKIQHTVTQYFMTQRVKIRQKGDAARDKYITQLTSLHGMLIHAMKAKQTTDVEHCRHLRSLLDGFAAAYFNAEDLKHIRAAHGQHHK